MTLQHLTVGVMSQAKPKGTWVVLEMAEVDRSSHKHYLTDEQAIELAARLIQAVTALAPIDLAATLREATSG